MIQFMQKLVDKRKKKKKKNNNFIDLKMNSITRRY